MSKDMKDMNECLKRRPRNSNIFHVIPFALPWGNTVDFDAHFLFTCSRKLFILIYALLIMCWTAKNLLNLKH